MVFTNCQSVVSGVNTGSRFLLFWTGERNASMQLITERQQSRYLVQNCGNYLGRSLPSNSRGTPNLKNHPESNAILQTLPRNIEHIWSGWGLIVPRFQLKSRVPVRRFWSAFKAFAAFAHAVERNLVPFKWNKCCKGDSDVKYAP